MSDPDSSKISRLGDLARDVPPPHDGWPALEARLRQSERSRPGLGAEQHVRPRMMRYAALAAVIAAVVVGISIDRWVLSPGHPASQVASAPGVGMGSGGLTVAYVTDPRYVREREAMLRSLNARLARLPPPTQRKVLESLATIHRSMQEIQQALGREPGNALLQELLIDTCQNEMQVLSTVQEASGGGGET
ncbi:MAG TPA: hypothetical protein VHE11_03700 [Steroidobacteraceae bacterium]|nr:hypothetical protein [Steroidobacteraceae bacterium]